MSLRQLPRAGETDALKRCWHSSRSRFYCPRPPTHRLTALFGLQCPRAPTQARHKPQRHRSFTLVIEQRHTVLLLHPPLPTTAPPSPVPTACGGTAPDRSRLEERSPAPHSLRSPAQRLSSLALAWTHSLAGAHARRAGSGTAGDESDEARPAWARRPTGAGTSNSWTNSPANSAQELHCNTRRSSL